MDVRYPGHLVRTRRHAAWLAVAEALVLAPLAMWSAAAQALPVAIVLVMLTAGPFVLAFEAWRFLDAQERVHQEPTPGMMFAFRLLASTPLTMGALMLVLLIELHR
jgi:hypothetical protein